ncbi:MULTISPECIES: hypothetical protein [Lacrimispora]|uniref:hypothetical protein n=1 Tax=Lacrimispora TaxID=2719231 RepID=UPI001408A3BD|nr:hypothetical protein [Lacrimispora amygdalina]MDK2967534.1 hypothetical protein [Lacrimispora sp.]
MVDKDDFEAMKSNYKEMKVSKMVVNGKEREGNVIHPEDTRDSQQLNVTVYTQND